jgi:hypothetical protein
VTSRSTATPGRGGALVTGYDHALMVDAPRTEHGEIGEETLWTSLCYFLDAVLPVAEEAGVTLAMHPDDPPLSPIRGLGRIMRSVENFQRLVQVGTSGSGQETPFEAIRLALSPPLITTEMAQGGNLEFLRDGARLLIVVVTDEGDCSESRRPPTVTIPTTRTCQPELTCPTDVNYG